MRYVLALSALALAGCGETPVEQAERRLQRIQASGATSDEICSAKRDVANAYLDEGSQLEYDMAKVEADLACNQASIDRLIP